MSLVDRRLLGEVKHYPIWFGLTIGLNLAGSLTAIAQASWLSWVISGAFFKGYSLEKLYNGLSWLFALVLVRSVLAWGGQTTASKLAIQIKAHFRQKLYKHFCALGPAALRQESTGEIIHLLTEGVEALDAYFSQYLPQLFLAVSAPLLILAFVFPQDALSGFVFLATAPLIPLFMVLIGNRANQLTQRQWSLLSHLSAYFLDLLQGLTTLKVLGYSREQAVNLEQANERYRKATMGVLKVSFLSALSLEMISTLSTAILAVSIGLRLLAGRMTFEPAFFILVIAPEFYLPLRMLGVRFHASMAGSAVGKRLFELLETKAPRKTASRENSPKPSEPPEIRFEHVEYTYPNGRNALRDLSFTLAKGKVTALVGASGAGKSTVAGLLLGFLTPSSGNILVNGKSLQLSEGQHTTPACAWVPQTPFLFQDTVLANIRLGEPSATLAQVQEAARLAHADHFIQELPDGYETIIGERGQRLSSGQAQRIALARAFLHNAPILILDEPTSSLDPESENLIREAFQRLAENRTVLVIAHRLNTTAQADQIVVLGEGRVIEQGQHAELIAKGGVYARLAGGFTSWPSFSTKKKDVPILTGHLTGEKKGETTPLRNSALLLEESSDTSLPPHQSKRTKFSTLIQLFCLLRPYVGWMVLSILTGFLTVSSSVGLMSTSAFIITLAALRPSIADLQVAIVGVRFFGISRGVFRYLERLISHETTFRILAKLRTWFYLKVEPLAPAIFLKFHSGDIFTRLHADLSSLESFFVRSVAPPLVALISILVFSLCLTLFHPSLTAIFIGFQIMAGIGLPLLVFILGKRPGEKMVRTRAEFSRLIADGIQGMADLMAFGQIEDYKRRVTAAVRSLMTAQSRYSWIFALGQTLGSGLAYLGMWAVLSQTIVLLQLSQINPLSLGVLALFTLTSFEAVMPIPEAAQQMGTHLECAKRLFEIAETPPAGPDLGTVKACPDRWDLSFEKVSFHYPGGNYFELKDITFDLPQGKKLAIVGPSGSGKTTLLSLLLGFWEASEGKILLNAQDLRSFQKEILRRKWGVVWQQTVLFNTTLRENLRLAAPGASQSEIERACEQAQLTEFIASLPQGYDTPIGEAGLLISGGERQRLAIARALLKNPPLLILDEPTANLDTITERAILNMIYDLSANRSLIVTTHRLVLMEAFDEILVMHQGRIVERGQHTALLAQGKYYTQLWQAQNQLLF